MKIRQAVGAIVTIGNEYILILKTKINTTEGKKEIQGEWDFIKGGVEKTDSSLCEAVLRELKEETGKGTFSVIKEFEEKISFEFSQEVADRIGYHFQEITMFLVEYTGENKGFLPQDDEISEIGFFKKEEVLKKLAHYQTREFFKNHCLN
ncbi:NUDIX hydrolase [Sutcliffiella horikoshii]|uniref:NUDIX hydrolase n=1 Tax=Sutcliffiella horikoshii TaxID=79883 RepID=A0A1Y0CL51_9BACI|nr:NUDIX hydrolase [Sutcliffiella horikoshii]ART76040.1 NUDIX hydrolase [Sutcliffiella horikoshii]TYS61306.1 NUDIX hydrolase [Sutcliffiella horikoshii]